MSLAASPNFVCRQPCVLAVVLVAPGDRGRRRICSFSCPWEVSAGRSKPEATSGLSCAHLLRAPWIFGEDVVDESARGKTTGVAKCSGGRGHPAGPEGQ